MVALALGAEGSGAAGSGAEDSGATGPGPAGFAAAGDASARLDSYSDPWIVVLAPSVSASTSVWDGLGANLSYVADFVSGATPLVAADAVSSATRFDDVRHAPSIGLDRVADTWSVRGSYALSVESDHRAQVLTLGGSREALARRVRLDAALSGRAEVAGRADLPDYAAPSAGGTLDLGWSWVLDPLTTLRLRATGSWDHCAPELGCHANPYRLVRDGGFVLSERHPDTRGRGAGSARVARSLPRSMALHLGYRYSGDTWRVRAHTGDAALAWSGSGERLVLRGEGRGVQQSGAAFLDESAGLEPSAWRSGDIELAGLWAVGGGLGVELSAFSVPGLQRLSLVGKISHYSYHYPTGSPVHERPVLLLGGGLVAHW